MGRVVGVDSVRSSGCRLLSRGCVVALPLFCADRTPCPHPPSDPLLLPTLLPHSASSLQAPKAQMTWVDF